MIATNLRCTYGKWLCGFSGEQSGSALVELALIISLLGVPLLLGTGEVGPLIYDYAEVQNAAHAAALYGSQSLTFAVDPLGMAAAARSEATDVGSSLVVIPITFYACSNAIGGASYTGNNAQAYAKAACVGTNNHPLQFVQVSTSLDVFPTIRCPGLGSMFTLTGSSVMEVQQ